MLDGCASTACKSVETPFGEVPKYLRDCSNLFKRIGETWVPYLRSGELLTFAAAIASKREWADRRGNRMVMQWARDGTMESAYTLCVLVHGLETLKVGSLMLLRSCFVDAMAPILFSGRRRVGRLVGRPVQSSLLSFVRSVCELGKFTSPSAILRGRSSHESRCCRSTDH